MTRMGWNHGATGWVVLLSWALWVGCTTASAPPPRANPAVRVTIEPAVDPAAEQLAEAERLSEQVERLYVGLEAQVREFEAGLEMLLGEQPELGREQVIDATVAIRAATLECSRLDPCDLDVFFAAYDYLLEEQSDALQHQGSRILDIEAPSSLVESPLGEPVVAADEAPYRPDPEAARRAAAVFRGTDLRQLIQLNDPVKAALDDWLTWMRPQLMSSWMNYQFLRAQMAPIYESAGLPEALLFGMLATESGGKVHAYSRAGAAGPLQFMRSTGRIYGLRDDGGFDLRLDPAAATRANVAYLNHNLELFNFDLEKVLAAYNGGESRMKRIQRSYPTTPFWDRRVYYQFPRETRDYVPRVLAASLLFLDPERFHLTWPAIDTEVTRLRLSSEASLGELAVCLGQEGSPTGWFRTLRNLNPRLEPGERRPAGSEITVPRQVVAGYEEHCRSGELLTQARALNEANYPAQPAMIPYRVRRGDTLGRIASRYPCVGLRELAAINRVRGPSYLIREGQTLRIPDCR